MEVNILNKEERENEKETRSKRKDNKPLGVKVWQWNMPKYSRCFNSERAINPSSVTFLHVNTVPLANHLSKYNIV